MLVTRVLSAIVVVALISIAALSAAACSVVVRPAPPPTAVVVTATAAATVAPTLQVLPQSQPIDVEGQDGRWRIFVQAVDRPTRMPPFRVTPTPESWRERAEGQFLVVLANVENVGTTVPNVSSDLGSAVVLRDGSGREYAPLRGASAAYALTIPGAPGNPFEARLQPLRGMSFAFVFDVPASATSFTFGPKASGSRLSIP